MHADDEHLLVVGAVEDADVAARGQTHRGAPQEVVVDLVRRRNLERVHLAALRVDAGHDVLDGAVLARRVHRLEDDEERPTVVGVEARLQVSEQFHAARQELARLLLLEVQPAGVAGVVVGEAKVAAGHSERLHVLAELHVASSFAA